MRTWSEWYETPTWDERFNADKAEADYEAAMDKADREWAERGCE